MLKVIEVLAESETSWEAAARSAVEEASRTLRNVRSIYIKNFEAQVADDQIVSDLPPASPSIIVRAQGVDS